VNLRRIDLNLLVILDALIAERSVSRAAQRLGLTQSAVSHALRRLRTMFGDDLLVRGGVGMEPSWRAQQLAETLRATLAQIETLVSEDSGFDPATSRRVFRLRVSDYLCGFLLSRLGPLLRAEAPGIRLDVKHFRDDSDDVIGDEIHVRLSTQAGATSPYRRMRVFEDAFVVVMSKRHPAASLPMTIEQYLKLVHLKVAATAIGTNLIDDALARRGLTRDIAMGVPSWLDVPQIVATTDLAAALPRRWTQSPAFAEACVTARLPLDEVELALDVVWHTRHDDDPGHVWLRAAIARTMQEGDAPPPRRKKTRHARQAAPGTTPRPRR
jgi:DNA-binding transcriptional LysR family regulator